MMFLDCSKYPPDYTFAGVVGKGLGLYVNVANFSQYNGQKVFRMIVDTHLTGDNLQEIMDLRVSDGKRDYNFDHMEVITGPVVDQAASRSPTTQYLRLTYC